MKLYILSVMFSADPKQEKSFILTSANNDMILPLIEIENPEFFNNEILYKFKSLFIPDSIKASSDCSYSFLDIQNDMSVQYARENYNQVDKDDIIVTYGGILLKYKCQEDFQWAEYKMNPQHKGYSSDMNLNLLLNYVTQKMIL